MGNHTSRQSRTLAEKLDQLFRTMRPATRGEFTYEEVAEGIRGSSGPTISATYVWQLRKGIRDNPTKRHLEALATFFGVPASYFLDDEMDRRLDAEMNLLAAMRDSPVREIATRAFGLSSESLNAIAAMVENARRLEGLSTRDGTNRQAQGRRSGQGRAH